MNEKRKSFWRKFMAWKHAKITLWSSAVILVVALGVLTALLATRPSMPADPGISGTDPTGTSATVPGEDTTTPDNNTGNSSTTPTNGSSANNGGSTNNGSGTNNGGNTVDPSDTFVPTTRFVVTSDVHTRTTANNYKSHDRLAQLYQTAYAYSDAQSDYKNLDGIFFVGDITNNGTLAEYKYFFDYIKANTRSGTVAQAILGNHEFYDTGKYTADSMEDAPIRFMEQSNETSIDKNQVIGGYHFITMGMDQYNKNGNTYFSTTKLNWLKQQLDAAVAEDPSKPIFLFQHEPAAKTVVGSYGVNGDNGLKTLLANYPQVIDFSGHSHLPLTNPRSVWQDTFTAVNTGSLAYLCLAIPDSETYADGGPIAIGKEGSWGTGYEEGDRNGVMYLIVETDQHNRVRIQIYDMVNQKVWGEPYMIDSLDPKDFKYTDARKDASDTPVFAANTALTLRGLTHKTAAITIPQATSKDVIQSYRVELYQGNTLKETVYRLAGTEYGISAPENVYAYFGGLTASTAYTAKVYAVNSWAKESTPLVLTFTTKAAGDDIQADVLNVSFRQDGTAVNAITGQPLTKFDTPTTSYDSKLGKYVATFDGKDDGYTYDGIHGWYGTIAKGFSIEAYVYLESKPTSGFMDFAANLNSAGFGLAYKNDGKLYFYCHAGDSYATPSYAIDVGQWVHVVGTFDGENACLYVNGQLAEKKLASGTLKAPTPESCFFAIGADTGKDNESLESFFKGKLADVNIYSTDLSPEQIQKLYNAHQ